MNKTIHLSFKNMEIKFLHKKEVYKKKDLKSMIVIQYFF